MDPRVQKKIIPFDLEKLKGSIKKHEENISSFEKAINDERQAITDEQRMIIEIEARQKELNGS